MSAADTVRRAAALMRMRAENAIPRSWSPEVDFALARWLEEDISDSLAAASGDENRVDHWLDDGSIAVARAYLGETS